MSGSVRLLVQLAVSAVRIVWCTGVCVCVCVCVCDALHIRHLVWLCYVVCVQHARYNTRSVRVGGRACNDALCVCVRDVRNDMNLDATTLCVCVCVCVCVISVCG